MIKRPMPLDDIEYQHFSFMLKGSTIKKYRSTYIIVN